MFCIDGDAVYAEGTEGVHHIDEPGLALEDAFYNYGLHNVELELAGLGCKAHGGVVTYDLEAYLVGYLRDHGVHLAGHNGRAGGHGREINLMQAAAGTGSHQAEVVTGLG